MHSEVHGDIRPNRRERWPWEGHVHPLSGMDDEALREFVRRDQALWEQAEHDPDGATRRAIEERIFFRRNSPRLGEPLYRSPGQAELDQRNMYCGRGTGHLGTGFYFFGTLRAAVDSTAIYDASPEELREMVHGVYAVDMEHVPDERIFMPGAQATQDAHSFAKALLCWPPEHRRAEEARDAVRGAQEVLAVAEGALDLEDTDEAFYATEEAKDALRDAQRAFRGTLVALERSAEVLGRQPVRRMRPNGLIDDILDVIEETKDEPRAPMAYPSSFPEPEPTPAPLPVDLTLPELPAPVAEAIRRYLDDAQAHRFPGYHPMTYYMTELGYEAVLHASWGEFNSGDIGCIWYP